MKSIIIFIGAIAISSATLAQAPVEQTAMEQPVTQTTTNKTTNVTGGVMKKNDKMWFIKALSDSILLQNDMVVYASGVYKTDDGETYVLQEGGRIDFEGAVEGMDQRIDEDNGMVVRNNGQTWVWSLLDRPILLANGNYVLPDGTLRVAAGKYVAVDDDIFIGLDGSFNEEAFK